MNNLERLAAVHNAITALGRFARVFPRFALMMIGAGWGVAREAVHPSSWRRTARIDLWRSLRQATGGGLLSILVTAVLTGFGIVAQAVFWLGFAGMAQMTGAVLSSVLVKEIAPVLVGVILLGRSGMLILAEMGTLSTEEQMRGLIGMGIDPFLAFVMPRSIAMTISGFTLGIIFGLTALSTGYIVCWVKGIVTMPIWTFMTDVINSVHPIDYIGIPLKFLLSGFVVGLCSCLSGMDATREDNLATLLPRGFARGILSVMIVNVAVDLGLN